MLFFARAFLKQWKWQLVNGVLALVCVVLIAMIFGQGDELARRAYLEGRRMKIDLADGLVTGKPVKIPPPEAEKKPPTGAEAVPQELPAVIPDTSPSPASAEQPQINPAMAGNFVGEQLTEHPAGGAEQPKDSELAKKPFNYPVAVKQEPQTRMVSAAAPAKNVGVRELLEPSPAGKPLPPAPQEKLVEKTDSGELPRIGNEGELPRKLYAKEFSATASEPLVAVVITGLGLGKLATQSALMLEENFTLSFSPYSKESAMWVRHARTGGHEVMLDLPMQTADYPASDPGPNGLLLTLKPEENRKRLHWILSQFSGYVGLLQTINASIPPSVIQMCLNDISSRGLLLAEFPQKGAANTRGQKMQMGLVSLPISFVIDEELEEGAIRAKLAELAAQAKKDGVALGVARSYPLSLELLQRWQKELAAQGVRLAPVSALAERVGG
jgi:polysaccharide deacetylase 2 family uncharacterized protein YibQ